MSRQIDRATARRFLAIRHLLAPPRALPPEPQAILAVVDRLGSLQFDPLGVAGRNHDLVLHARIGGYRRELTDELLYERRLLFETNNKALNLLPTRELPYYRIAWERAAAGRSGQAIREHPELAARLLEEIEREGPRSSLDFEREAAIEWFWGPTTAARAILEALNASGRLGLARRDGNRRYYDLVERLFPADLLATRVPEREQLRHKLLSRYRGHGLLGTNGSGELWTGIGDATLRAELRAELVDRGELVPLAVEAMRGERFIVADELPLLAQAERELQAEAADAAERGNRPLIRPGDGSPGCAFLAPLDPLLWDRAAIGSLYDFEYVWEVYTPAAKRRWGYYVLPVLFGDRLVGRIEPRIDRAARAVRIVGLAWEPGFDPLGEPGFVVAFGEALRAYLAFGGAERLIAPPGSGHRPLLRALRALLPLAGAARGVTRKRPATVATKTDATRAAAGGAAHGATAAGGADRTGSVTRRTSSGSARWIAAGAAATGGPRLP